MNTFYNILSVPFGWMLGFFYDILNNYLLSIIFMTLFWRIVLVPFAIKQQKNAAKQMRLQAKVNKIRQKYAGANTREAQMKMQEETTELYSREGFSASTAGCLPMFFQLFVMMGLYGAIYSPLSHVLRLKDSVLANLNTAYAAVTGVANNGNMRVELDILNKLDQVLEHTDPTIVTEEIAGNIRNFVDKFTIFGINLTAAPKQFREFGAILIVIPVVAGLTAMLTSIFMYVKQRKENPEMANNPMMGCMTFMSPLMSIIFAYTLPAGIGFYWIISNILSFIQTVSLSYALKPEKVIAEQMIDETVQRRSREQSIKIRKALLEAKEAQEEKQNN